MKTSKIIFQLKGYLTTLVFCLSITATADPLINPDTLSSLKDWMNTLIQENPMMAQAEIYEELEEFLRGLRRLNVVSEAEANAIRSKGWGNWIRFGWPGASNSAQLMEQHFDDMMNQMRTAAVNDPALRAKIIEKINSLTPEQKTRMIQMSPAVLAALQAAGIAFAGVGGATAAFIGLSMLMTSNSADMDKVASVLYASCITSPACAIATLVNDDATVLTAMLGGDISKYMGGTFTDFGPGVLNPDRRYAWVSTTAVPGFKTYRFPNGTVLVISNDNRKILGTTIDGVSFSCGLIPAQPGVYACTFSNGARATLSSAGLAIGTGPGAGPSGGGGGGGGGGSNPMGTGGGYFWAPPTVINTGIVNYPDGTVTACWYNGSYWDCGE